MFTFGKNETTHAVGGTMTTAQLRAAISYLKVIVATDPQINAQDMGQCIYCGVELDRRHPHLPSCHYLEAQRLLKEFESTLKQNDS